MSSTLVPETHYDATHKFWYTEELQEPNSINMDSIGQMIYAALQLQPTKIAQISVSEHTILTKGEMLLNAIRIATYLRNLGIDQNDIVGIVAYNTTHLIPLIFALFFNGTAYHSVNPGFGEDKFQAIFEQTKPKLIFCDAQNYNALSRVCSYSKIIIMKPDLSCVTNIEELLQTAIDPENFRPLNLEHGLGQTLAILSTSGTGGMPKAVPISNNHRLCSTMHVLPTDIQFTSATADWIASLKTVVNSAMTGSTLVISDLPFDPIWLLNMVQDEKISCLYISISQIVKLLNCAALEPRKLDSVRVFIFGGGRCTMSMVQRLQDNLPNGIVVYIYGLTEAGATVSKNFRVLEEPISVGHIMWGFRIKIIDEQGCSLGPGARGEICIDNGEHFPGYIGNSAETQSVGDEERWLHTGDIGYFDENKKLYVIDRKSDRLKYDGIVYYPMEVEVIVAQIDNVMDACAFGIWNEMHGDAAAVAIVKKEGTQLTPEEVVDYVKSKTKALHIQLNGGVFFFDEFPKSPNGKISRKAVHKACLLKIEEMKSCAS